MNIGELWVSHPVFPWLVYILAAWILCASALFVKIWSKLTQSEKTQAELREEIKQLKDNESESGIIEEPAPEITEDGCSDAETGDEQKTAVGSVGAAS